MENIHEGHRERLRRRFQQEGLDGFDDVHVLELILTYAQPRIDTSPLAHRLLDEFGSLLGVLTAPPEELMKVEGVGKGIACYLELYLQVLRRCKVESAYMGKVFTSTEQCGKFLVPRFFMAREEEVYILCLDARCKLLDCRRIHRGSVNAASISVRKIVEYAIRCNASSVVLAHNHTSGIALPSREDKETTKRLYTALEAVGIRLSDHIIVGGDDYVSLADDGFFEKQKDGK